MNGTRRIAPILVLIALALLPLWRCVVFGEAIGPWDAVRAYAPFNEGMPNRPFDVLQMDSVLQFPLWRDLVFENWRLKLLPVWNPYVLMGTPLLANSQSGALYPPHILLGLLGINTYFAITLLAWLHLALAGLGTRSLILRYGGSHQGALIGGAAFMLSPFMLGWTALGSVISTVCWIPWCLAFVKGSGDWVAAEGPARSSRAQVPLLAVCITMMILAGHLQFAFYGILATLILALSSLNLKTVLATGLALVTAALISAPHWGPVMAMGQLSHRRAPATVEGYAAYQSSAIQPWEWLSLMDPQAMGSMNTFAPPPLDALSTYWPALVKLGSNPAESAVSIGPVVLLGLLGLRWKERSRWAGLAILGFLAALLASTPLNAALYYGIPGFSATGSPGRIIVLFVLAACTLAGIAIPHQSTDASGISAEAKRHTLITVCAILVGAVGAYVMQGLLPSWNPAASREVLRGYVGAGPNAFINLAVLVCAAIYGATLILKNYQKFQLPVAFLTILVLGLPMAVRTGKPIPIAPRDASTREATLVPRWELLMQFPGTLPPPNLPVLINGTAQLSGYDSLLASSSVNMLKEATGQEPAPPTNGNMMLFKGPPVADPLSELGVTKLAGPVNSELGFKDSPGVLSNNGKRVRQIYWNDAWFKTVADEPGTVTLRQANLGNWKAYVNGKPTFVGFGHWPEVADVKKDDVVEFRYEPDLKWPLCIAGTVLLAGIWLASELSNRQRRQSASASSNI